MRSGVVRSAAVTAVVLAVAVKYGFNLYTGLSHMADVMPASDEFLSHALRSDEGRPTWRGSGSNAPACCKWRWMLRSSRFQSIATAAWYCAVEDGPIY